jgi:hypothetical protein
VGAFWAHEFDSIGFAHALMITLQHTPWCR